MNGSVPVIAFAAYSGTGKTTLIEKLVRYFAGQGIRTAVIKHDAHGIDVDREGKDSWRFTQAGAVISMVSSPEKTAFIQNGSLSLAESLAMIHDVDLVFVEGYKNEPLTQIGLCRQAAGKDFTAPLSRFAAVVTDRKDISSPVPVFSFDEIQEIGEFIMKNQDDFTHFNEDGRAKMVDVGDKEPSRRTALAGASVLVSPETFELIRTGGMKKGDVLTVAQIAGIMGAKHTPDLIPMCHPVLVDGIDLHLSLNEEKHSVEIEAQVSCAGRTGVEMEALTAVSAAALTVYDMCKAVQKDIVITDIRLIEKTGGVHGDYHRKESI